MATSESWRARVVNAEGKVCGAGILLAGGRVLTCAHVVAEALGVPDSSAKPAHAVMVEFPAAGRGVRQAFVDKWVPVAEDGRGDLALLRLEGGPPQTLAPARLARCFPPDRDPSGGHAVRAYGYPAKSDDGVWAQVVVVGTGGPSLEWVEFFSQTSTGHRVDRGFSGAGALSERTGAVVGVVVAAGRVSATKVGWMIPMEMVAEYIPTLLELLVDDPAAGVGDEPATASAAERQVSRAELQELFKIMKGVPGIREPETREWLVSAVGFEAPVERHEDPHLDIWGILDACLAVPGGPKALVVLLEDFKPESPAVATLRERVERLFPDPLLDRGERLELETLLDGASPAWVAVSYRHAISEIGVPVPITQADVKVVIRHLETFGHQRGIAPPLFSFVDHLAHLMGGGPEGRLHLWIDRVRERLLVDRDTVRLLCTKATAAAETAKSSHLVVQLQPDRVDAERYLLSAWLQHGHRTERTLLRDDLTRTLDEVVTVLSDELLPQVHEHVGPATPDIVVEFVLPRALITYPVHRWEYDPTFPTPLGIRYPVVVRSLERLRKTAQHQEWRRKWRQLVDHGHREGPERVHWLDEPLSTSPQALYADLTLEDRRVCLAMAFPPSAPAETIVADEFAAGIAAGMPVIMWSTEQTDPQRFRDSVRNLLAGHSMHDLPRRTLQHRRNATRTAAGQYPDLGLLWDDPDRIPAAMRPLRLQAPQ